MKLKEYRLGDLIEVTRGASLAGDYYASEGKYKRITLGNFNYKEGGFKDDTQKEDIYYTGKVDDRFILRKGDILTPLTEQALGLLGSTIRIPEDDKYIQSQDVALITCKEGKIDPDFCYYLISSAQVRNQLSAAAQQTKIRHTSPDKIKACKVFIPDLAEQKKIGQLLRLIEEKISLNKQINQNLEALAKQLYDYWFVQFDFPDENGKPYKSSGGAMVYNEKLKRDIPKGWEVKHLRDFSTICRGSIITEAQTNKGNIKVVAAAVTFSYLHDKANRKANVITISSSGANAGYMNFWREPIFASDCITIQCDSDIDTILIFHQLELYRDAIMQKSHGSAQPHVYPTDIDCLNFVCIPNYLKNKISTLFITWNKHIANNVIETEKLIKQRDELLPLLMNGQVTL